MVYGSDIPMNRGTQGQSSNGDNTINRIGEVSFVDEEVPIDPELEEIDIEEEIISDTPPEGPVGDIVFSKTIFSKVSFNQNIDNSFNELNKVSTPVDLSGFFRTYNNLFFDIPKEGEQSHNSIIKQSTDYIRNYIDPKDEIIRDLEEQIRQLELELAQPDELEEHPVFKNGTMIRLNEPHQYYYMDKGYRRYINWNDDMVDAILLTSTGTLNKDLVPIVTKTMLENIPQGFPSLREENFGEEFNPRLNDVNEQIGYLRFAYDNDGLPPIDPRDYDSYEDFFIALNEDILQKREVLSRTNQLISQYSTKINQLRTLDLNYYNETYGDLNENGENNNSLPGPVNNY